MSLQRPGSAALVLASASSARAALLQAAGLRFESRAARIDEAAIKQGARIEQLSPGDTAVLLAEMKAMRVAQACPDALVIGADQLLVCEDRWFEKPTDLDEARRQLLALRGRAHVLCTAVVVAQGERRLWHHLARPRLVVRPFSDSFLDAYLALEARTVTASVGAYRLEGPGMHLFETIDGEYAAILGLPMLALLGFLRQHRAVLA